MDVEEELSKEEYITLLTNKLKTHNEKPWEKLRNMCQKYGGSFDNGHDSWLIMLDKF
jgi:hypothetical protein